MRFPANRLGSIYGLIEGRRGALAGSSTIYPIKIKEMYKKQLNLNAELNKSQWLEPLK